MPDLGCMALSLLMAGLRAERRANSPTILSGKIGTRRS